MGGRRVLQFPGKEFCFSCGHRGILPELGVGNDFVRWHKHSRPHVHGGYWCCKTCSNDYHRGISSSGLYGWAKSIINASRKQAKLRGHEMVKISPEELIILRLNSIYCSDGCGQKLLWCTDGSFKNPHLHHNHKTGEVYGFVTKVCNSVEGLFSKIGAGDFVLQKKWLEYHFPEIIGAFRDI